MTTNRATHDEVVESTAQTAEVMHPQRVPVNAYTSPGAFVVLAPLPAVTPDDVTIELNGDLLRFWAELRSAGPREYLISEWEYGGYEREVTVPDDYRAGLEATLVNGQLAVRVLQGAADPSSPLRVKPVGRTW